MTAIIEYIKGFPFKNLLALPLIWYLFQIMGAQPSLHDSCVILLTLVVKYYYDTNAQSAKKDETISKALTAAQNTPSTPVSMEQPINNTTP